MNRLKIIARGGPGTMIVCWVLISLVMLSGGCDAQSSVERSEAIARRIVLPSPTPLQPSLKTDYVVRYLDGRTEQLSRLLGSRREQGKVLAINFWATWCGPCRREIPVLTSLDRQYRSRGVEIIGLTVEPPDESSELVKAFGEQFSVVYQLGFTTEEMYRDFSGAGAPEIIPQTFVFGRNGDLILHLRGYQSNFREMVEAAIERGLG